MQNKNKKYFLPYRKQQSNNKLSISIFLISIKVFIISTLFLFPLKPILANNQTITSEILINLTNQERAKNHLPSLQPNILLTEATQNKAYDMLQKDYFTHTSPDNKPFYYWIQDVEYDYKSAGENLAIDFSSNESIITAWMSSLTHRQNILDPKYQEIGIAVLAGEFNEKETTVVVQMFGEPLSSVNPVISTSDNSDLNNPSILSNRIDTGADNNDSWATRLNTILNVLLVIIFSLVTLILLEQTIVQHLPLHQHKDHF